MKQILSILLLLCSVLPLQGRDSYYYFKQISIKEGLPSSVTAIYDDEDGFLWIGTIYGIYRFDGEKLNKFPISNGQQVSPYVYDIKGDGEGHIWIFTSQGVSLYNPKQDILEPFLPDGKSIDSYTVLSDEKHIIIPVKGALIRYDKQLNTYTQLAIQNQGKQTIVLKMEVYSPQYYLALTGQHELMLIDRKTGATQASPFKTENQVWSYYRDSQDRYWIAHYGKDISCFTSQGKLLATYTPQNSALNNAAILDIAERNGLIWLATDGGGINIIHPETRHITILSNQQNSHFPANSVTCLDNGANNMWIGMVREGVLGVKENFITTYSKSPRNDLSGMSEKCPLCLIEDTDGTIWIGTDGGGVNSFNPDTEKFMHYPATSGEKIVSLCAYSKDELLISNYLTGLHLFNKQTGTYRKFTIIDAVTDNRIVSSGTSINLFINRQNEIELQGGAYYRYSKEKKQFIPLSLSNGEYGGSWIYAGDYQSKSYFQNQNCIFRHNLYTDRFELVYKESKRSILAACIDSRGTIWIANRNKLCTYNVDTQVRKEVKLPDNNDIVTSLVIDRQGNIWMGTPGALYAYSPHEKRFVIYSESDGVLPNDFLPKPVLVTRDDNIYMGGAMGLVRVNKAFYKELSPGGKLRLKLLDVQLNGTNKAPDRNAEIPKLKITSSFTSLVLHTKLDGTDLFRKRIYRYQIEGLNNDFTESSKSYLMIQTLPPGDYCIIAQCTMTDGLWSPPFTILDLTVLPPWWQRTWFIIFAVLLAISGLICIVHLREVRLQQSLKEKERKIYKDKVQALININHELRTPLTLIYSPLKQLLNSKQMPYELRTKLQGVLKQTRQMKSIINKELLRVECPTKQYLNKFLFSKKPEIQETAFPEEVRFHSVLIVEDDPDLCDFMAANLQSVFATTYVAHDGMEALPIIVSHLPQLIISDVTLPRISGLELCRRIKQNPELNFIPVILLAPDMDDLNAEDGYKTGADAYVVKPFDIDLLILRVQTILNNHNIIRKHYLTSETGKKPQVETDNYIEEQFVIHLNQVIADNLSNTDLDVNLVAKLMRMSRASLYNKMKAIVGIGVNEYITKQRIRYAGHLLTTTDLAIREISEKAGFLHQRNFSTTFKNITGVSPSEYRRNTGAKLAEQ